MNGAAAGRLGVADGASSAAASGGAGGAGAAAPALHPALHSIQQLISNTEAERDSAVEQRRMVAADRDRAAARAGELERLLNDHQLAANARADGLEQQIAEQCQQADGLKQHIAELLQQAGDRERQRTELQQQLTEARQQQEQLQQQNIELRQRVAQQQREVNDLRAQVSEQSEKRRKSATLTQHFSARRGLAPPAPAQQAQEQQQQPQAPEEADTEVVDLTMDDEEDGIQNATQQLEQLGLGMDGPALQPMHAAGDAAPPPPAPPVPLPAAAEPSPAASARGLGMLATAAALPADSDLSSRGAAGVLNGLVSAAFNMCTVRCRAATPASAASGRQPLMGCTRPLCTLQGTAGEQCTAPAKLNKCGAGTAAQCVLTRERSAGWRVAGGGGGSSWHLPLLGPWVLSLTASVRAPSPSTCAGASLRLWACSTTRSFGPLPSRSTAPRSRGTWRC